MKQNIVISLYQVVLVALLAFCGAGLMHLEAIASLIFIVGAFVIFNSVISFVFWKHLGSTNRSRITEAGMLVVSAFTPIVAYFTQVKELSGTAGIVWMYAVVQAIWAVSIYLAPDIVGKIRERRY